MIDQINQEEKTGQMKDYNIFMAIVDKVGHDKRGNPLFKRDKEGNDILISKQSKILEDSTDSEIKTLEKIIDDQTPIVSKIFKKWKQQEGISW